MSDDLTQFVPLERTNKGISGENIATEEELLDMGGLCNSVSEC
jgi:hypothetical protein